MKIIPETRRVHLIAEYSIIYDTTGAGMIVLFVEELCFSTNRFNQLREFADPVILLSMLSLIFVIVCGLLDGSESMHIFIVC